MRTGLRCAGDMLRRKRQEKQNACQAKLSARLQSGVGAVSVGSQSLDTNLALGEARGSSLLMN